MADEETREGADTPEGQDGNGRRGWPVITAVAVAVAVIAGGLYGVSGLLDDDGSGDDAAGAGGAASAPLVLDGTGASRADVQRDQDLAMELAAPVPLRLTGDTPAGPERAPVYGFEEVTGERVAEVAAVFGLESEGLTGPSPSWVVGGSEADGMSLTVTGEAPGYWSYGADVHDVITDNVEPDGPDASVSSPEIPVDDGGSPPSTEEALRVAEPLLADLGLADADVDAELTAGSQRVVRAYPVVDGLPVNGLRTELYIGADGEVASAAGALAATEVGEERAVTADAPRAVESYNGTLAELPVPEIACGPTDYAEPVPDDVPESRRESEPVPPIEPGTVPDCPSGTEKPAPMDVTAEFGLALHYTEQEAVLVPSWLFTGTLTGGIPTVLSHPAVAFEYAADGGVSDEPAEPAEPGSEPGSGPDTGSGSGSAPADPGADADIPDTGWSIAPYEESDTTLTLRFWGGVCDDYVAVPDESGDEVTVSLETAHPDETRECIMLAEEQTTEIALDEAIGDRALLDERGETIPVR